MTLGSRLFNRSPHTWELGLEAGPRKGPGCGRAQGLMPPAGAPGLLLTKEWWSVEGGLSREPGWGL